MKNIWLEDKSLPYLMDGWLREELNKEFSEQLEISKAQSIDRVEVKDCVLKKGVVYSGRFEGIVTK